MQRLAACCPALRQLRTTQCALASGGSSAVASLMTLTALHLPQAAFRHELVAALSGLRQLHTVNAGVFLASR